MNSYKRFFSLFVGLGLLAGCAKTSYNGTVSTAALNVINAAPDVPSLNVNFTTSPSPYYLYQQPVYYGSSFEWGVPPGDSPVVIVSSLDTSGLIYSSNFNLKAQGIYSMYVLSSAKGNVLFMQDTIPSYTDSSSGVRFINLAPDSKNISVNLQGNLPTQTEFSGLGYEQISAFKSYPVTSNVGGVYNFEIRDQASDSLLTTYSWYYPLFKNNTIVISGSEANGLNIFQINNY